MKESDTNVTIFNNFLNVYLKICYACFTPCKLNCTHRYNPWIARGIRVLCQNKRILYMSCSWSNDTNLKLQYKRYCKISTNIIKTAKKLYYHELISKAKNKTKTTWKIIKTEIGNKNCQNYVESLKLK